MSEDATGSAGHDQLIIKRGGGGHHDEHHGGVWKIAFADFMTAMMAFFLVMWLISANDKTKAVIAKYFNPIELVDSTPQPRGLSDPKKDAPNVEHKPEADAKDDGKDPPGAKEPTHGSEGKHGKQEREALKGAPEPASAAPHPDAPPLDDADRSPSHAELELIRDPYAVLAEIAGKTVDPAKASAGTAGAAHDGGKPEAGGPAAGKSETGISEAGKSEAGKSEAGRSEAGRSEAVNAVVGTRGGEAYRDPFQPLPVEAGRDPFAIPGSPAAPRPQGAAPAPGDDGPEPQRAHGMSEAETASGRTEGAAPRTGAAEAAPVPVAKSDVPAAPGAQGRDRDPAGAAAPSPIATGAATSKPEPAGKPLAPAALRAEIAAAAKALDPSPTHAAVPGIEVRRTDEGLLVSLTDTADFAMFPSASARPAARSVALMATVGRLLKAQKGMVVVRGFTDSRPFRSDVYDNWRLSSERAHMAQYMLVRGGLDERRIDRVEGLADRHPRNARDTAAPENRRIEILLQEPAP